MCIRDRAYQLLTQIPGVSVVKPKAALYMFPRLDPKVYPIADDQQFAYELLAEEKVLIVQGTGFNWIAPDHFRLVFLPNVCLLYTSVSAISSNGSSRFCLNFSWLAMLSRDTPKTTAPAFRKSLCWSLNCIASVVHPGVLSLG